MKVSKPRGKYQVKPRSLNKRVVIMVDAETELFIKEHGPFVRGEIRKLIDGLRTLKLPQSEA